MNASFSSYLLVGLVGAISSYFGIRLTKDKKIEKDASVLATVLTKLDNIIKTVEEIRVELKVQERMNLEFGERLAKVELSAEHAHRRISEVRGDG